MAGREGDEGVYANESCRVEVEGTSAGACGVADDITVGDEDENEENLKRFFSFWGKLEPSLCFGSGW